MKLPNRDLLVLVKDDYRSQQYMEYELEQLNQLLAAYETMDCFCIAHEVFDVNKNQIITSRASLRKLGKQKTMKAFVFFYNKN